MRHKMVSLCPTTYEKAQKIENFSKWVRDRLLEDNAPMEEPVKHFGYCTRCGDQWSSYVPERVPHACIKCLRDGHDPKFQRWTEKESEVGQ